EEDARRREAAEMTMKVGINTQSETDSIVPITIELTKSLVIAYASKLQAL
ncbi:hypothetical protein Moror_9256, partial [Moniliophthora roreri MCA 2997]